jgi:hypothetical protein
MLRSVIIILFLAISLPSIAQLSAYENESLQFVLDYKEGVVLVPIERIEPGIKQNSLESSRKEESNLAIFNAFKSSSISEYYFFYKENLEHIKKREFEGKLLGLSLQPVDIEPLSTKAIFLISFLEPGHISYPEVRTFKKSRSGLRCDIRNMVPGKYPKRESEAYLRSIRDYYYSARWETEEVANQYLDTALARKTEEWRFDLAYEGGMEYFKYRPSVDGDMYNRDFGRFPVMELRRLEAVKIKISPKKHALCLPKYEARIYPELSQWETIERAVAEIGRQIEEQILKNKKLIDARTKNKN